MDIIKSTISKFTVEGDYRSEIKGVETPTVICKICFYFNGTPLGKKILNDLTPDNISCNYRKQKTPEFKDGSWNLKKQTILFFWETYLSSGESIEEDELKKRAKKDILKAVDSISDYVEMTDYSPPVGKLLDTSGKKKKEGIVGVLHLLRRGKVG